MNVEILGVNSSTDAPYNSYVTATSGLPWLQDTTADHVWSDWKVAYRDVRILDARNRVRAVYNLSTYDLSAPANREALKALFLEAARVTDADGDGLMDDWEEEHWGSLTPRPHDDPDGDGADNATEFAFGSNPRDANSKPTPLRMTKPTLGSPVLELHFRRRAGAWLHYAWQGAPELGGWGADSGWVASTPTLVNYFDGTGTALATLRITPPPGATARGFVRLRVVGPP